MSQLISKNPLFSALTPEQQATLGVILTKCLGYSLDVQASPNVTEGSRVTLYRVRPQGKTRTSAVANVADELALALQVESVFIQAIPTEGVIGIYIPRRDPPVIPWYDLLAKADIANAFADKEIPLLLGSDWLGKVFVDDLTLLPHLLIAGSTGSGKSVGLRSILATIVHKLPNIKLVLSDTKGTEFNDFNGSLQLLYGERAVSALRTVEHMDNLCKETDTRLERIGHLGARNIKEYNQRCDAMRLPYIILAIDELADIVDLPTEKGRARRIGAEKLDYLTRKARAAGIHVIASTQRPSVDVVKGVVKSNFIARVSYRMPTAIDSRVVLDEDGAQNLMKLGDCLYKSPNFPGLLRLHTGYATSQDIRSVLEYSAFKQSQYGGQR